MIVAAFFCEYAKTQITVHSNNYCTLWVSDLYGIWAVFQWRCLKKKELIFTSYFDAIKDLKMTNFTKIWVKT